MSNYLPDKFILVLFPLHDNFNNWLNSFDHFMELMSSNFKAFISILIYYYFILVIV